MAVTIDNHYHWVHLWLIKTHGRAKECVFCRTSEKKRFEWALLKGKSYERNLNNFIQLCPSCHRKYDMTEETRRKLIANASSRGKFGGDHPAARPIYSIDRKGDIENFASLANAVNKYGYKYANISMNLTGKNPSAYGKRWYYQNNMK